MSNPHRIEQRIVDLQIRAWNAEKTIEELQETIKAQAGWIMGLDDRLRELEQKGKK